ncbi:MAG: four helix bundle protein [Nitrospiraceae bacterium]|nr:MAG: four helix bundle protein [Nitrospiraceae bacterium]
MCLFIYKITKKFSKDEQYVLTSQIRRAAVSVPSNIERVMEERRLLNT